MSGVSVRVSVGSDVEMGEGVTVFVDEAGRKISVGATVVGAEVARLGGVAGGVGVCSDVETVQEIRVRNNKRCIHRIFIPSLYYCLFSEIVKDKIT